MKFSSYITVITYVMVAVGFTAMCMVEGLTWGFLVFSGAVTLASLALRERLGLPAYLWNALAGALFLFFLIDYFLISQTLIASSARLIASLIVLKLYDLKKTRDHLVFFSLVFFELSAGAASTVSPFFFFVLSVFIVSSIWAMVVLSLKKDSEEYILAGNLPDGMFGGAFFLSTLLAAAASVIITLFLFFIIPRAGIGLFQGKTLAAVKVAGFSDVVSLGSIGPVKLDPTVVMRVHIPEGTPPRPLYLRGTALDYYDGTSWKRKEPGKELLKKDSLGDFSSGSTRGGRHIEYNIMLEPLETDVLFVPSPWLRISGRFSNLWRDKRGNVFLPSPPYSRIEYTVWGGADEGLGAAEDNREYLQLPADTERIKTLASEITDGVDSGYGEAKAIEEYLRKNYRYTLDPERGGGPTPLEDFLFFSKEGYCEHYATAMAALLRTRGIPARLVTGFLEGEWNRFGNYFLVRQMDAHSWVEALIKENGAPPRWRTFDPTPEAGLAAPGGSSPLGLYIDSLKWRWTRHIIGYSRSDQIKIATAVEVKVTSLRILLNKALYGLSGKRLKGRKDILLGLFASLFAAAGVFMAVSFFKGRMYPLYPKTPRFYIEMLKILRKKGFERKGSETPLEFSRRTGQGLAIELTEAFHEERYGGKKPGGKDKKEIGFLLESIKKARISPVR
ncbi:MAG: DUF3488 domain-containing protein [Deltaproteobacteria bacterium]|nr:DUF3488 domain-containing protein [Deltaproteobacteria bacterium]